jgi:PAS domain S-box-containing protein
MNPSNWLFDTSNLTPHGLCLTWEPTLLWLEAGSDAITAIAYFSIPLAVMWFARRRRDLPHRWFTMLFAGFILACGSAHVIEIITLWIPVYNAEVAAKLVTAGLSIVTAIILWPLVPKLLALPSPGHLETLNHQLRSAHSALQSQNKELDRRVNERTEQLAQLNDTISRNEIRFRQVVEGSPSAMVMIGTTGLIEMVNAQTEQMFGYSRMELIGRPIEILIPARYHARHPGLRTAFCGEPQARPMGAQTLLFGIKKNGREFEVEIGLNPIETDDGPKVLSAIIDISARVQVAAKLVRHAKQATLAKSRFLANVSHELRTPLNGILGYAQLLQMEGKLDQTQKGRVEAMLGAGQHLLGTINSVLDLSEIEAERLQLHLAQFDLFAVVTKCISFVRPNAEEKGLGLALTVDPDLPQYVMGDRTRLQQVLTNLLGNAVKFTSHGGIELRAAPAPEKGHIRFRVSDSGPGIPAGQLGRIFQDFERLDSHVVGAVEGSGLGLALCVRLAALMGGNLRYEDNPGGGSAFCLEVSLETCAAAAVPVGASAPVVPKKLEQSDRVLRILVADDIAMNRDIADAFLQTAGHIVTSVEDGAEAVAAVAADDFDVVLMDIRMPHVDGLEATRRIRALEGVRGAVPIIGVTAQAFVQQIQECREAGMDGHLSKPFTLESLLGAVRRAAKPAVRRDASVLPGDLLASPPTIANGPSVIPVRAPSNETPLCQPLAKVFDRTTFDQAAVHLAPEVVLSCLQTLSEQAEHLWSGLLVAEAESSNPNSMADAAHALAGSAGMFGFDRLCATARQFEHAVLSNATESAVPTADLVAALKTSLSEMQKCRQTRIETVETSRSF